MSIVKLPTDNKKSNMEKLGKEISIQSCHKKINHVITKSSLYNQEVLDLTMQLRNL